MLEVSTSCNSAFYSGKTAPRSLLFIWFSFHVHYNMKDILLRICLTAGWQHRSQIQQQYVSYFGLDFIRLCLDVTLWLHCERWQAEFNIQIQELYCQELYFLV